MDKICLKFSTLSIVSAWQLQCCTCAVPGKVILFNNIDGFLLFGIIKKELLVPIIFNQGYKTYISDLLHP